MNYEWEYGGGFMNKYWSLQWSRKGISCLRNSWRDVMEGNGYREWSITTGLKHFQGERGSGCSGAIRLSWSYSPVHWPLATCGCWARKVGPVWIEMCCQGTVHTDFKDLVCRKCKISLQSLYTDYKFNHEDTFWIYWFLKKRLLESVDWFLFNMSTGKLKITFVALIVFLLV